MTTDAITTGEAARLLGITVRRVQMLIKAERLKASKHGRDWLIDRADLAAVTERKPGRPRK